MSVDTLTKDRMSWLDRIARDPNLSPGAFRIAYVISGLINRETGDAWPGLDHLANVLSLDEKSIRRLVDELVSGGYLVKQRGGNGRPNRYRMQFSDRTEMPDQADGRPDNNVHSADSRPDKYVRSAEGRPDISARPEPAPEEQTGHFCPSDRTFLSMQTGHICPPISLKDLSEDLFEGDISPPTSSGARQPRRGAGKAESRFEEFYAAFPRKVSKGAARKAWAKAVRLAEPATIIAGAERYARERSGEDPRFTKHPATWLNAEAWHDEPAPQPVAGAWPGSRATAKEQTGAAVAHILGHGDYSAGRRSTVDTILETLGGVPGHDD